MLCAVTFVAALAVVSCGTAAKKAAKAQAEEIENYKAFVLDLCKKAEIPSMQVCYTEPGKVISFAVTNEDFYADPAHAKYRLREIDNLTQYEACSISKVPLGYLACRAADKGILDLDKPLYEYCPEILDRFAPSDRETAKQLTARICLTHTCGLDNKNYKKTAQSPDITFKYPIGEYHYSGPGIFLVQLAMEKIWGETLDVYSARELFKPLGMNHTNYLWQPYNEQLSPYGFRRDGRVQRNKGWSGLKCNAAYSMRTTAEEFTIFLKYIMDGGDLSKDMYEQMLHKYIVSEMKSTFRGLAWRLAEDPELGLIVYHTGNNGSFRGNALCVPSRYETLVFFYNGEPKRGSAINDQMTKTFFKTRESIPAFTNK